MWVRERDLLVTFDLWLGFGSEQILFTKQDRQEQPITNIRSINGKVRKPLAFFNEEWQILLKIKNIYSRKPFNTIQGVCLCMCECVSESVFLFIWVCTCESVFVCVYVSLCLWISVCVGVSLCEFGHVCNSVFFYEYGFTFVCVYSALSRGR